jgi:AcrR family transcriptional regulator
MTKDQKARAKSREYVVRTYDMLVEDGYENISIRKIAKALDCNVATLYRYFGTLDDLIATASVRCLQPYYQDIAAISTETPNAIEIDLLTWQIFAYYAFHDVPIYQNLFFNPDRPATDAINRYFDLFPEDRSMLKEYLFPITQNNDLREHNRYLLNLAADQHMIDRDSVDQLVNMNFFSFAGLLQYHYRDYREEGVAEEATKTFMDILRHVYKSELLPGVELASFVEIQQKAITRPINSEL